MNSVRLLVALCFGLLSSPYAAAQSDEEGNGAQRWYAGGGISVADVNSGSFGGVNGTSDRSHSDTGTLVTLGYTFSEHLAIEVGFLDAGSPRFESTRGFLCADPDLCQVRAKQATEAATVAAIGVLPVGAVWEFYGKAGLANWSAKADQRLSSPSGSVSIESRADRSGTDLLLGGGVAANVASRVRVRLEYQFFDTDEALLAVDRTAGFEQLALEVLWRF